MIEKTSNTVPIVARMFVAGESPTSMQALSNWRSLESHAEMVGVHLEIVDVLAHPQQALENRVLATPMLILTGPIHKLRYMGTLDDNDYILRLIGHCRGDPESA